MIARPVRQFHQCETGMFAGRTIYAEVNEVQKANVGRKWVLFHHPWVSIDLSRFYFLELNAIQLLRRYAASKYRHCLDPPPVVQLRIYDAGEVRDGIIQETEVDYR